MPTNFACPNCLHALSIPNRYAGRRVLCPKCRKPFVAPASSAAAAASAPARKFARFGSWACLLLVLAMTSTAVYFIRQRQSRIDEKAPAPVPPLRWELRVVPGPRPEAAPAVDGQEVPREPPVPMPDPEPLGAEKPKPPLISPPRPPAPPLPE